MAMRAYTTMIALAILLCAAPVGAASDDETATPAEDTSSPGLLTLGDDTWYEPDAAVEQAPHDQPLQRRSSSDDRRVIGANTNSSGGWLRTVGSLAAVVALIVLLLWGYRMIGGAGQRLTIWGRTRQPFLIDIVAKTPLSNKQSICLVRVGSRLVLVGVCPESMNRLDVIEDENLAARLLGQAAAQRGDSHSAEFNQCLSSESDMYTSAAGSSSGNTGAATRVVAARDVLGGVIANLRSKLRSV
ncbi:MAG: flagellar biosynthetic protein FliO [Phycisphaerae bacterium]|nr:flagellar biosynthetic protein FliO [Phycisphaerae bacterium]